MKNIIVLLLALTVLSAGCTLFEDEDAPLDAGVLTAELPELQIPSGDNARLVVDGQNTGNTEMTVGFIIVPKNPESVQIRYPGELTYVVRPQETTGRKIVTVTATTEAARSDYEIDVIFRNMETGEDLDTLSLVLTVTK